jgi:hypothetical protein
VRNIDVAGHVLSLRPAGQSEITLISGDNAPLANPSRSAPMRLVELTRTGWTPRTQSAGYDR